MAKEFSEDTNYDEYVPADSPVDMDMKYWVMSIVEKNDRSPKSRLKI